MGDNSNMSISASDIYDNINAPQFLDFVELINNNGEDYVDPVEYFGSPGTTVKTEVPDDIVNGNQAEHDTVNGYEAQSEIVNGNATSDKIIKGIQAYNEIIDDVIEAEAHDEVKNEIESEAHGGIEAEVHGEIMNGVETEAHNEINESEAQDKINGSEAHDDINGSEAQEEIVCQNETEAQSQGEIVHENEPEAVAQYDIVNGYGNEAQNESVNGYGNEAQNESVNGYGNEAQNESDNGTGAALSPAANTTNGYGTSYGYETDISSNLEKTTLTTPTSESGTGDRANHTASNSELRQKRKLLANGPSPSVANSSAGVSNSSAGVSNSSISSATGTTSSFAAAKKYGAGLIRKPSDNQKPRCTIPQPFRLHESRHKPVQVQEEKFVFKARPAPTKILHGPGPVGLGEKPEIKPTQPHTPHFASDDRLHQRHEQSKVRAVIEARRRAEAEKKKAEAEARRKAEEAELRKKLEFKAQPAPKSRVFEVKHAAKPLTQPHSPAFNPLPSQRRKHE